MFQFKKFLTPKKQYVIMSLGDENAETGEEKESKSNLSYHVERNQPWLVDSDYMCSLMNKDDFVAFHDTLNSDVCLEIEATPKRAYTDEQAKEIIEKVSNCTSVSEFQRLDRERRNRYLATLKEKGLSIRQISRLTGVSFNIVKRA